MNAGAIVRVANAQKRLLYDEQLTPPSRRYGRRLPLAGFMAAVLDNGQSFATDIPRLVQQLKSALQHSLEHVTLRFGEAVVDHHLGFKHSGAAGYVRRQT